MSSNIGSIVNSSSILGISLVNFMIGSIILTGLILLYIAALPHPIPGIPHNNTHRSLLGDIPALLAFVRHDKEYLNFFMALSHKLDSPVIQLFLRPFSKPLILLNDFRESEDLLNRRSNQFDTSDLGTQIFSSAIPNSTIAMPTHDFFKSQRRLWAGTMAPEFINRVVAPRIFTSGEELIELWKQKTKRANGAAFCASGDLRFCALDAIWESAMGSPMGALATQIDGIKATASSVLQKDGSVEFEGSRQPPPLAEAIETVLEGMSSVESLLMRRVYNFVQRYIPRFHNAFMLKERIMRQLLKENRARFTGPNAMNQKPTCAMEQVLQRQATMVEKAGFVEAMSDDHMVDELFLWLVAGHETTALSIGWALKALAENLHVQQRLREALRGALGKNQADNSEEILAIEHPYLDAVLYEILRVSRTTNAVARVAIEDTTILGYPCPKGTHVIIATNGFTALNEQFFPPIPESSRSPTSQQANKTDRWSPRTITAFNPDRWLKEVDGESIFNPNAGPWMPFGGGPRGCFGKRLAMVEMRIFVALLLTNFDFMPVPDQLNSYAALDRVTRVPVQCYVRPRILGNERA